MFDNRSATRHASAVIHGYCIGNHLKGITYAIVLKELEAVILTNVQRVNEPMAVPVKKFQNV